MKTAEPIDEDPPESAAQAFAGLSDLLDGLLDEPDNGLVRIEAKRLLLALQFRMDEQDARVRHIDESLERLRQGIR